VDRAHRADGKAFGRNIESAVETRPATNPGRGTIVEVILRAAIGRIGRRTFSALSIRAAGQKKHPADAG
jgi:hypothetical protein